MDLTNLWRLRSNPKPESHTRENRPVCDNCRSSVWRLPALTAAQETGMPSKVSRARSRHLFRERTWKGVYFIYPNLDGHGVKSQHDVRRGDFRDIEILPGG